MSTQNSAIETIFLAIYFALADTESSSAKGQNYFFFTLTMIRLGAHKTVEVKG